MNIQNLKVHDIKVEHPHPLNLAKLEALKRSIQDVGLINPITVNSQGKLICGMHRLSAVIQIGWDEIPAVILEGEDADRQELAMLDENIMRRNLSTLERCCNLAAKKRIYLKIYPETRQGGDHKSTGRRGRPAQQVDSFVVATAKLTGVSQSTIKNDVFIGERLGDGAKKFLEEHKIELNKTELLNLAKSSPENQLEILNKRFKEKMTEHKPISNMVAQEEKNQQSYEERLQEERKE